MFWREPPLASATACTFAAVSEHALSLFCIFVGSSVHPTSFVRRHLQPSFDNKRVLNTGTCHLKHKVHKQLPRTLWSAAVKTCAPSIVLDHLFSSICKFACLRHGTILTAGGYAALNAQFEHQPHARSHHDLKHRLEAPFKIPRLEQHSVHPHARLLLRCTGCWVRLSSWLLRDIHWASFAATLIVLSNFELYHHVKADGPSRSVPSLVTRDGASPLPTEFLQFRTKRHRKHKQMRSLPSLASIQRIWKEQPDVVDEVHVTSRSIVVLASNMRLNSANLHSYECEIRHHMVRWSF